MLNGQPAALQTALVTPSEYWERKCWVMGWTCVLSSAELLKVAHREWWSPWYGSFAIGNLNFKSGPATWTQVGGTNIKSIGSLKKKKKHLLEATTLLHQMPRWHDHPHGVGGERTSHVYVKALDWYCQPPPDSSACDLSALYCTWPFHYFYCPNTGQCPVLLELKAITYMEEHRARALYFVSTTVHLHTPVERLRVRSH